MGVFNKFSAKISFLFILLMISFSAYSSDNEEPEFGSTGFFIIFFLFVGIITLTSYYNYIRSKIKNRKAFLRDKLKGTFFIASLIILASVLIVNIFIPTIYQQPANQKARTEAAMEDHSDPLSDDADIIDSLKKIRVQAATELNSDYLDPQTHYQYVNSFAPVYKKLENGDFQYLQLLKFSRNYYKRIYSNEADQANVAHYALCIFYARLHDIDSALFHYNRTHNKLAYQDFEMGRLYFLYSENESAKIFLHHAVRDLNEVTTSAYPMLINIYEEEEQYDSLQSIFNHPVGRGFLSANTVKTLYLRNFELFSYVRIIIMNYVRHIKWDTFIPAMIILLVWLIYLIRLDHYEREHLYIMGITLLIGMIIPFMNFYFYDFLDYYYGFNLKGSFFNDFLYAVFGIGLTEELVKIIPLLIIMQTRVIDEPFDYILYACISALGFAFMENMIYFDSGHTSIIHARALTAVVAHMVFSSFFAYGFVLWKYKRNISLGKSFLVFWLISSTLHGLYDFIAFNAHNLLIVLIFLLFFLFIIRLWTILINNALNNSPYFSYENKPKLRKMELYLVITLSSILAAEYIYNGIISGTASANKMLVSSIFEGSILIFFISGNLSKLDPVKGYWQRIKFIKEFPAINGIFSLIHREFKTNKVVPQNFINTPIHLEAYEDSRELLALIPNIAYGKISGRKIMIHDAAIDGKSEGDIYWFLITLDNELDIDGHLKDCFLIKFEEGIISMKYDIDMPAYMLAIPEKTFIEKDIILYSDFTFLGSVCVNNALLKK